VSCLFLAGWPFCRLPAARLACCLAGCAAPHVLGTRRHR
jgi:hypothetical protein